MADNTVAAEAPRFPDPSSVDLSDKSALLKYLEQLNQTLSVALQGRPIKTTPRNEYLLISPNGLIKALRLKDDGTTEVVEPGKRPL